MDGLKDGPGLIGVPGVAAMPSPLGSSGAPEPLAPAAGVPEADAVRLFGAAYRMLGSASRAREVVRDALAARTGAPGGSGPAGSYHRDAYDELVRDLFGALLRGAERGRARRDGHAHTAAWLAEPVLTAGGALGPMDTAARRASVSMARLVLLERLAPGERAAYVLREVFGYGPEAAAAVLGVSEERSAALERRARQRVLDAEGAASPLSVPPSSSRGQAVRVSAVAELLRAIRDDDPAGLEELLADDVVAWSDGGGQPGVVRRPVLGTVKVGRFLATVRGRIPADARGHLAEVNGDPALVAVVGSAVVGVLAPEFGPQGMIGIRAVADPARLEFIGRQWADLAGRPALPDGSDGLRDPGHPV
ncbi:sigma factor-like helix-turn-helix DNA-binding protein [Streptomyces polygonati]|uniref:Sigma factor-like helix-turn-helix DNA-binding protein n=1 Tax=Streptomyces polygonati TaxID=1617087 RepID=A0ABV8HVG1_9ACTN